LLVVVEAVLPVRLMLVAVLAVAVLADTLLAVLFYRVYQQSLLVQAVQAASLRV
jgi:hypothetical protein